MLEYILPGVIGVVGGILGTYAGLKLFLQPDIILDFSDVLLDEVQKNTDFQKRIYMLGALLGNGVKSGLGLPKAGGKMKFEDLIMTVAGQFLSNMGKKKGETTTEKAINTSIPQHLRG